MRIVKWEERIEAVAEQLFYIDWDREHILYLVDNGSWGECPSHIKDKYRGEAKIILDTLSSLEE